MFMRLEILPGTSLEDRKSLFLKEDASFIFSCLSRITSSPEPKNTF